VKARWRTVVGVAAVIAGGLFLLEETLAGALALDETLLVLVGLLAVVQGIRYVSRRRDTGRAVVEFGEPEVRHRVPVPGESIDAQFDRAPSPGRLDLSARRRIRERVTETAVETLVFRRSTSPEAARRLLEDGAWTDDPVAAAFLGDVTPPLRTRVLDRVSPTLAFALGARATQRALDEEPTDAEAGPA